MEKQTYRIETVRHSLSHVLAAAVLDMFPEAKLGIGPAIDNGFYYDFDLPRTLIPEDLPILEKKMRQIIAQDLAFEQYDEPKSKAVEFLNKTGQSYKTELVEALPGDSVSFYSIKKDAEVLFVDLCKGPHVWSTKDLQSTGWKLDKIAGAYWKGSEKNKMLQRIYALAFEDKEALKKYENFLVEAERRNHRKIGEALDLFSFHEEGPGFAFWHPKGMVVWNALLDWWREEHRIAGYDEVKTPIILSQDLWHKSGHWDHYKENMYFTKIDERDFAVKPMNCPGSILIYKDKAHSYREFPIRRAEIGLVHRHELTGVLHGLMRVRSFHQDDAHIFCLPSQIEDEVVGVYELVEKMYKKLGLKYHVELSTRPESGSIGNDEMWQSAESSLKKALDRKNIDFKLNPGDGAFYGPKIDFHIEDAIGRTWQTATIQVDFAMPERFEIEYVDEAGHKSRPVMIHRTVFGSLERFIGILIEHFAGAFPLWLAPVQVKILPIAERHVGYAEAISEKLKIESIRVEIDDRNESIGKKVREAEMQKIPYMLVVGDKEVDEKHVSVREYGKGDRGSMLVDELIGVILKK